MTRVTTSLELRSALQDAMNGSVIQLAEGVYSGPFVLRQDGLTIRGQGNASIIQLETGGNLDNMEVALNIFGNNCKVHNLKMISKSKFTTGVNITGSGNHLTNIYITNYTQGFAVYGDTNILSSTTIQNMRRGGWYIYAVVFVGNNNSVNSLDCNKCTFGIHVDGDHNSVIKVQMRNTENPSDYWGIYISSGSRNLVDFFRGRGEDLLLGEESSNSIVRDVVCGSADVDGTGHTLVNVNARWVMVVKGSGHEITNSTATRLFNLGTNVTIIQSAFESEE